MKNKIILEFSEFNAMRLNPNSTQMAVSVDDPQLSINAFDKHQDAIRDGISRITNILKSLSNSSAYNYLKSKFILDSQQIQSLKILKIINSNGINYNVYVSFVVDSVEYFGVVENILDIQPTFKSEIFFNNELVQKKEWVIRTKGLIIKSVKKWLLVEPGKYELINNVAYCYSVDTNKYLKLKKNTIIEVVLSYDNKILMKIENEHYNLLNDNFIYFNWWFIKL